MDRLGFDRTMILRTVVLFMGFTAAACGGDDDTAGNFTVLDKGEGEANVESLFPLRDGMFFRFGRFFGIEEENDASNALIRGPFEMEGRSVYRLLVQRQNNVFLHGESYQVEDEHGVWLVGGTEDGMLPSGILTVPAKVKLGKKWKSSPGGSYQEFTFEVTDRSVLPWHDGEEVVFWEIGQIFEGETEPSVYRVYAEGWGQVSVANRSSADRSDAYGYAIHQSIALEHERAAIAVPEIALQPATPHELPLNPGGITPLDQLRGIRSRDGTQTHVSVAGIIIFVSGGVDTGSGANLTYFAGDGTGPGTLETTAFSRWMEPRLESLNDVGFAGRYRLFGLFGNAIYTAAGLFASTTDHLFYENAAGGVSGFRAALPKHGVTNATTFLSEETVVAPGLESVKGQIWGGHGFEGVPRVLQGPAAGDTRYYGLRADPRYVAELWTAETEDITYGKFSRPGRYVDKALEAASTLTTEEGDVHYLVAASGFIERISFGADGTQREFLGRAQVPVGQTLTGAIELGDGYLLLATHDPATEQELLWYGKAPPTPIPSPPSSTVSIEAWGFDMRVCWGQTDGALDATRWILGGVPALAVVPAGEGCALILRDLAERPKPEGDLDYAPGWNVVEGPVPGVGRVKGMPGDGPARGFAPIASGEHAWRKGGGFFQSPSRPSPDSSAAFGPGGMALGKPGMDSNPTLPPVVGLVGNGVWIEGAHFPVLETDGTMTLLSGIALAGPEPKHFLYNEDIGAGTTQVALRALNSGGLLISNMSVLRASEHLGLGILRPDGSLEELEHPAGTTPMVERANGELCGTRLESNTQFLYCATPAGLVREAATMETAVLVDLYNVPSPISALIDDRLVVMQGDVGELHIADFETLEVRSYATPTGFESGFQVQDAHVGADGILYGKLVTLNLSDFVVGAFTAEGFRPARDIVDVKAFFADPAEASGKDVHGIVVGETLVHLQATAIGARDEIIRVPRAMWDAALN